MESARSPLLSPSPMLDARPGPTESAQPAQITGSLTQMESAELFLTNVKLTTSPTEDAPHATKDTT